MKQVYKLDGGKIKSVVAGKGEKKRGKPKDVNSDPAKDVALS